VKKSFNIQELLHHKSKGHGTKPMHPFSLSSLLRAFQRHEEHDIKHPCLVDLITTKQNKLPSFIDRFKQKRYERYVTFDEPSIYFQYKRS
jgi:hypothetical protein